MGHILKKVKTKYPVMATSADLSWLPTYTGSLEVASQDPASEDWEELNHCLRTHYRDNAKTSKQGLEAMAKNMTTTMFQEDLDKEKRPGLVCLMPVYLNVLKAAFQYDVALKFLPFYTSQFMVDLQAFDLKYYEKSREMVSARSLNMIGSILKIRGEYDKALSVYETALQILEPFDEGMPFSEKWALVVETKATKRLLYTNLGITHRNLYDPEKALMWYWKARECLRDDPFLEEATKQHQCTVIQLNRAMAYHDQDSTSAAAVDIVQDLLDEPKRSPFYNQAVVLCMYFTRHNQYYHQFVRKSVKPRLDAILSECKTVQDFMDRCGYSHQFLGLGVLAHELRLHPDSSGIPFPESAIYEALEACHDELTKKGVCLAMKEDLFVLHELGLHREQKDPDTIPSV